MNDGRYIEVNEAFEQVMGYRRDEVIGRPSQEFNIWKNPEEREKLLWMLAQGKKVRGREIGFRSKSGDEVVALYSAEIIDIGGEHCLLSLANDVTERMNELIDSLLNLCGLARRELYRGSISAKSLIS